MPKLNCAVNKHGKTFCSERKKGVKNTSYKPSKKKPKKVGTFKDMPKKAKSAWRHHTATKTKKAEMDKMKAKIALHYKSAPKKKAKKKVARPTPPMQVGAYSMKQLGMKSYRVVPPAGGWEKPKPRNDRPWFSRW